MLKRFKIIALLFILTSGSVGAQSFLHTDKYDIVDENGQKIMLRGVGLGNWMLPEGYMWKFGSQGDRPRRIEKIVADYLGAEKATAFWKTFRKNYITEADIRRIAELGYNSVRPALNSRLFITETKPHVFVDEGFELLDNLIKWCKKYKLYVIIDMHGAPGGQTGQNIDDSPNDLPELFSNAENQDLLERLWVEIATRYKDEPTVAAYDLLNEPLPSRTGAAEQYKAMLVPLYERLIKAIRAVDKRHIFTLEGYDWSNNWSMFDRALDDNMFYQFHYYCWNNPDNLNDISGFLKRREQLQTPVWVGETGERNNTIYYATMQYFEKNNIGWSFWPWKKMETSNTPYSIKAPQGWANVTAYSQKGEGDKAPDAQRIFDELLENIKLENCVYYPDVVNAMLRRLPLKLEAENYGHDGEGVSYKVNNPSEMSKTYRTKEPVKIETISQQRQGEGRRGGGGQAVRLAAGEWTSYKIESDRQMSYNLTLKSKGAGLIILTVNNITTKIELTDSEWNEKQLPAFSFLKGENTIKIEASSSEILVDWINID
jgi:aryl-phospho-beta-D-glucosidase BglC (GH1 family)